MANKLLWFTCECSFCPQFSYLKNYTQVSTIAWSWLNHYSKGWILEASRCRIFLVKLSNQICCLYNFMQFLYICMIFVLKIYVHAWFKLYWKICKANLIYINVVDIIKNEFQTKMKYDKIKVKISRMSI